MKPRIIVVFIAAIMVCVAVMAPAAPLNETATFEHLWNSCWVYKTQTVTIGNGDEFSVDFYVYILWFRMRLYSYKVDVSEDGILIDFYFLSPAYKAWTFGGEFQGLIIKDLVNQDDDRAFQGLENVASTMDFNDRTINDMFTYDQAANEIRFNWTGMTMYNGSWLKADFLYTDNNSPPTAAPTGGGVYEIFTPVTLGGNVSDVDGDMLVYQWTEADEVLFSGTVAATAGGDPVALPADVISDLSLGDHTLTLSVDDGINNPVMMDILVQVVDTTAPTMAPVPNLTVLWPANHDMIDIIIQVNASDNSGGPVTLAAQVTSNEPIDGLAGNDQSPDWTEPEVTSDGSILLQLRAERDMQGDGRVYTVVIYATDESGNTRSTEVAFIVPRNQTPVTPALLNGAQRAL